MKNKDIMKAELRATLTEAMQSNDEGAVAKAFADFAETVQQSVMEDVEAYRQTDDVAILARRGIKQLTHAEQKWYEGLIVAMRAPDARQAITGIDNALPETVIDRVMEDIKAAHPLLAAISFTPTSVLTKIIINKQGTQLAMWGAINSAVSTELAGSIGKIDLTLCKLSAYIPVAKDMLEAGPQWIDSYVRSVLSEAVALGLEQGIITGTGKDMPIGMDRDVSDDVTVIGGVYPQKTPEAFDEINPITYGKLLAIMSKAPNGRSRAISEVLFIVNPTDYFGKVFPSTTVRATDGSYTTNVFPFPTRLIQSTEVPDNRAIIGIGSKYFIGVGTGGEAGKITYSDDFKFLDDERVYLTKVHANGRALDDNAFLLLDITNLKPTISTIKVIDTTTHTASQT